MSSEPIDRRVFLGAALALAAAAPADARPTLSQLAPAFRAIDDTGRKHSLADFAGKIVVLEWTSDACPYSHKHYESGAMQNLQRRARAEGVVWLTVMTMSEGAAEYMRPDEVRAWRRRTGSVASAILLDYDAKLAAAYEAKTTPHMFIIDPAGRLVYMGAIDDRPYADPASLDGAKNYVDRAISELKAGRPISEPVTRPYGCAVKYPPKSAA